MTPPPSHSYFRQSGPHHPDRLTGFEDHFALRMKDAHRPVRADDPVVKAKGLMVLKSPFHVLSHDLSVVRMDAV